jgi:hypothetical protein
MSISMCRSEINCINLSKVILESKGIIAILIALSFHFILMIYNPFSISNPANPMSTKIPLGKS